MTRDGAVECKGSLGLTADSDARPGGHVGLDVLEATLPPPITILSVGDKGGVCGSVARAPCKNAVKLPATLFLRALTLRPCMPTASALPTLLLEAGAATLQPDASEDRLKLRKSAHAGADNCDAQIGSSPPPSARMLSTITARTWNSYLQP